MLDFSPAGREAKVTGVDKNGRYVDNQAYNIDWVHVYL